MKKSEEWLQRTAIDYDMDVGELRNIVHHHNPDDDIYHTLEEFIANRKAAEENGQWQY